MVFFLENASLWPSRFPSQILESSFSQKERKMFGIAVITVISAFDIQTRLVGHSVLYRMVLTHQPRLRAFLNKRKLDCRLNCNNSYSNTLFVLASSSDCFIVILCVVIGLMRLLKYRIFSIKRQGRLFKTRPRRPGVYLFGAWRLFIRSPAFIY